MIGSPRYTSAVLRSKQRSFSFFILVTISVSEFEVKIPFDVFLKSVIKKLAGKLEKAQFIDE